MSTSNTADRDWWRSAVVYQVYPRSFADGNGDGTGDLSGLLGKLPYLKKLGVDAIWLNPWYASPLADGGYDVSNYRDILPEFGTLAEAEEVIKTAHAFGLRILLDLVPNHSSDQHAWFQEALAAPPDSPARDRYLFRTGRGPNQDQPPTNWTSMFYSGTTWEPVPGEPGQYYLHLFAPEQPDFNWANPEVADEFDSIIRFWFDRGVDGFRVDVADAMVKDPAFPDMRVDPKTGRGTLEKYPGSPIFDQPGVHDINRRWRKLAAAYTDSPRVFIAEVYLSPASRLAAYVRPDELHQTFNFEAMRCAWDAASLRGIVDATRSTMESVGAPTTWVLSNHDTIRPVTRYGKAVTGVKFSADGTPTENGLLPADYAALPTDVALGRRRARALALLELALPGGAYIYQGDELGLEEVADLPDEVLQDPMWENSGRTVRGRDGCRVPLPWQHDQPGFGFSAQPWLPQPARWKELAADVQDQDPASTLNLYRAALAERRANPALGDGTMAWDDSTAPSVLSFTRDPGFGFVMNLGDTAIPIPPGAEVIIASAPVAAGSLPPDSAAWLRQ